MTLFHEIQIYYEGERLEDELDIVADADFVPTITATVNRCQDRPGHTRIYVRQHDHVLGTVCHCPPIDVETATPYWEIMANLLFKQAQVRVDDLTAAYALITETGIANGAFTPGGSGPVSGAAMHNRSAYRDTIYRLREQLAEARERLEALSVPLTKRQVQVSSLH